MPLRSSTETSAESGAGKAFAIIPSRCDSMMRVHSSSPSFEMSWRRLSSLWRYCVQSAWMSTKSPFERLRADRTRRNSASTRGSSGYSTLSSRTFSSAVRWLRHTIFSPPRWSATSFSNSRT